MIRLIKLGSILGIICGIAVLVPHTLPSMQAQQAQPVQIPDRAIVAECVVRAAPPRVSPRAASTLT